MMQLIKQLFKTIYIHYGFKQFILIGSAITSNPVITKSEKHKKDIIKSTTTSRTKARQHVINSESLEGEFDNEIKQDLDEDSERDITKMKHPKMQKEDSQEDGFTERFNPSLIQSTIGLPIKTTGYKRYWRNFEDKYV